MVTGAGLSGDALFRMPGGFTGVPRHCPLLWGGDQSVDFSRHDGLPSAIRAALSSGLVGNPYHHSDIGGYMSLYGNRRTPELLMRWAEMAAFTAVMRTHEGNRPGENVQIDSSPALLAHFARMTCVFRELAPYRRALVAEAVARGLPMQRALFQEFPDDAAGYAVQDAYLFGPDLLVAPVQTGVRGPGAPGSGRCRMDHVWTGASYRGRPGGDDTGSAGRAAGFFRHGSGLGAVRRVPLQPRGGAHGVAA